MTLTTCGSRGFRSGPPDRLAPRAVDANSRAEQAFVVARALTDTVDAQHTASVILADAGLLSSRLTGARRAEIVDELTEHASELRDQLESLHGADLDGPSLSALTAFAPTIEAVLADASRLEQTSGVLSPDELSAVRENWEALDERSDEIKTLPSGWSTARGGPAWHRRDQGSACPSGRGRPVELCCLSRLEVYPDGGGRPARNFYGA